MEVKDHHQILNRPLRSNFRRSTRENSVNTKDIAYTGKQQLSAHSGKAYAISMIEDLDTTSIPRNLINSSRGSAFVNMSATLSHVGT